MRRIDQTRRNWLRLTIFLLVAGIHGALLFSIVFTMPNKLQGVPKPATKAIRLVDIREAPPEVAPKAAAPKPKVQPPPLPPKNPEPVMDLPPERYEEILSEPTETVQEPSEESGTQGPAVVPVLAGSSGKASPPPSRASAGEDTAALKKAYIRKNFTDIQRRIKEKLRYPPQARKTGAQGTTEVIFTIHQDGTISGVSVRVSSGQEILDQAAVEAIYAAAPFRPPPPVQARIAVPVAFKLR